MQAVNKSYPKKSPPKEIDKMGKLNWLQKRTTRVDGEMNLEELSESWKS